ncbi:MAG: hypothetical protein ACFFG0_04515 [Candidatus Thorarchaeota archaeon]
MEGTSANIIKCNKCGCDLIHANPIIYLCNKPVCCICNAIYQVVLPVELQEEPRFRPYIRWNVAL